MDPDSSPPPRRRRSGAARPLSRQQREDTPAVRVTVTDSRGRTVRDGGLARWLKSIVPRSARGELAIALVPDPRMRLLNRSYRRKDYATDVLSFRPDSRAPSPESRAPILGDIVIAIGVARRQAREAGHSYQTELRVLALHGLLHLLGYDHDNRTDRGRMARAEARLRKRGGLDAGLIARAGRKPSSPGRGRVQPA